MLATATARDGGEAGQWWHRQWAAQAHGSGGLRYTGARLRHSSGVRLRARLCADGGSGLLGLG